MPFIPGLLATPTVIANALFSLARDASLPVLGPDRVGVIAPMFNEELGAASALASLLEQTTPFDELVVSINGGTDDTGGVVRRTLTEHGYRLVHQGHVPAATATFERWLLTGGPTVAVVDHALPLSKSDSINAALEGGLLNTDRVLVVDGDTVLDPGFLSGLRRHFYRLRRRGRGAATLYVLEDYAIQSGSVMSAPPVDGRPMASLIHNARAAEYAISTVLRLGQTTRLGDGAVFGRSRLYTVVGCGFTARRQCFPMPSDTLTEDHDFTLAVQNEPLAAEPVTGAELAERGFRVVVDGEELPLDAVTGDHPVVLRRGGDARFVSDALMYTDDPPTLPGYLRQIERWNGGGVENALKRLFVRPVWRGLRGNVRFTLLAAQFENLLGLLLLLLMLPLALGLNFALPGHGTPLRGMLVWLGVDLLATGLLTTLGFWRQGRGLGRTGAPLQRWMWRRIPGSVLALGLLRVFNAVTFVTGALRATARFMGRKEVDPRATITWVRPRAGTAKRTQARFLGATGGLMSFAVGIFGLTAWIAGDSRPGYRDTWRLINESVPVLQSQHQQLPLPLAGSSVLGLVPDAGLTADAATPMKDAAGGDAPAADGAPATGADSHADTRPDAAVATTGTAEGAGDGIGDGIGAVVGAVVATLGADAAPADGAGEAASVAGAADAVVAPTRAVTGPVAALPPGTELLGSAQAALGLKVVTTGTGRHGVSAFCSVADVARPADRPRLLAGPADEYEPLSGWGLLVLARLAPLVANIEEAATAYDVPADLVLRVLLNESYLDPLAVGPTGDLGLSQVTSDALTLLRAISTDALSPFANGRFFAGDFSVFDPDFSVCAGAAKLAWARAQPGGADERFAYARYINPLEGVVRGKISPRHQELVEAIGELRPLAAALERTIAAYRRDPQSVTDKERALLGVTNLVADGTLTVGQAYFVTAELVQSFGIDDRDLYDAVRHRLYGEAAQPPSDGGGGVG